MIRPTVLRNHKNRPNDGAEGRAASRAAADRFAANIRPVIDEIRAGGAVTTRAIADEFSPAVLASSLSAEDMVLTSAIARAGLPIGIFVLDTGRLHAETLNLIPEIRRQYGIEV